jgi:hypothetical protein
MQAQPNTTMPAEMQIKSAVEEAMENIMCAIFGENLPTIVGFDLSKITVNGLGMAHAHATAVRGKDSSRLKADLPIRWPDAESVIFRIDDSVFTVEANSWAKDFVFQVYCETNTAGGAKVIVRAVKENAPTQERWMIADSMEGEVLYRGPWADLPRWAKEIVAVKWSHLPHVQLNSEVAAMVLFVSHKVPGDLSSADG